MHRHYLVALLLIVTTYAVFWPVQNHTFINFDDGPYVTQNPHVRSGLTAEGVIWALTATHPHNWHPLTWMSHMLDCEIFGLNPGGHHFTNLLFHMLNTVLLFLIFRRMTGALWPSALVASLFALHPLHVESVAWVSQRKDLLSTFFWMLTTLAYVRYVENPGFGRYFLALVAFTLGLMSKPMVVTLPFVLLLLDYWPLGRFQIPPLADMNHVKIGQFLSPVHKWSVIGRLVGEKLPFFALSACSCVVTFLVQQSEGAVKSLELFSVKTRITNALVSYVSYIGKMIWPHKLAIFYPHPHVVPTLEAAGAGVFLLFVTVLVFRAIRRRPYLGTGWLWYMGTLVPVIGLVQVGEHAMADRYTYVPLIGLFVIIAWSIPKLMPRRWRPRVVVPISIGIVLCVLAICTRLQIRHWHNSITLFERALDVTAGNWVAHNNLGVALAAQNKTEEAISHFQKALHIKPTFIDPHFNLGIAMSKQDNAAAAIAYYRQVLRMKPDDIETHNNLGNTLVKQGHIADAIAHYQKVLQIEPGNAQARYNLAIVMNLRGKS